MAPSRATNKWDYEIARVRSRVELGRVIALGCVVALCIAAAALPLWTMHGIVEPLAGKKTEVDLNVPITVAFGISFVFNLGQVIKGRSRRSEIKRERERADKLEGELGVTS